MIDLCEALATGRWTEPHRRSPNLDVPPATIPPATIPPMRSEPTAPSNPNSDRQHNPLHHCKAVMLGKTFAVTPFKPLRPSDLHSGQVICTIFVVANQKPRSYLVLYHLYSYSTIWVLVLDVRTARKYADFGPN